MDNDKKTGGKYLHSSVRQSQDGKPLVSIITVVYNGEAHLEDTIQSVINQTYDNIEYIIIDGGSTDGSLPIIKKYEDKIDYWVSERDKGIYDAMNKGIDSANGDWLLFLGADDRLYDCDTVQKIFTPKPIESEIVFGNVQYDNGSLFISKFDHSLLFKNSLHHQGVFYHKKIFNFFRYNSDYKILADYDLNLKLFHEKIPNLYINHIVSLCGAEGISKKVRYSLYKEEMIIKKKYIKGIFGVFMLLIIHLKFLLKKLFFNKNY